MENILIINGPMSGISPTIVVNPTNTLVI
ncbi:uncharacterized protein METZ01_LOCUS438558 [marine metagenome]|uniref:Uncharacterized protein n=1 Tax=marine metagenome TaxID=408172 RepID=A0A382YR72_9ZZZZ